MSPESILDALDLSPPEMGYVALFHASNSEFEWPCYASVKANRTGHENGLLGLWCGVEGDWVENFGAIKYEIQAAGLIRQIEIGALTNMGGDPQYFERVREALLHDGCEILRIVELDGRSAMSIIVNLGCIHSCEKLMEVQTLDMKPGA